MTSIDELAEDLAAIFERMRWVWGLELAGIPEHVPDARDVAAKIEEIKTRPLREVRLASHGRIALVTDDPEYPDHVRVLVDVGELPLPRRDVASERG